MAGRPVKFAKTVKMSAAYIATGSCIFSPKANAVDGDVGNNNISKSLKIKLTFSLNSLLTC